MSATQSSGSGTALNWRSNAACSGFSPCFGMLADEFGVHWMMLVE